MNIHIAVIVLVSLGIDVSCQEIFSSYSSLSKNFMDKQISCLMETGSCNDMGNKMKRLLLQNDCERCSSQQKARVKKLVDAIRSQYPAQWKVIRDKYNLERE
ncbi:ObirCsp5 [Ooceraea biroi]|uniref:ObirCsp5 n=1 Tax=Ooceraea biroi TaxID=2015173 RepID=A0A026WZA1_OOCBI|nr:ejaculatory bulb-specific protein 3 [Ooceraea biroi]EZA60474.1 hypothetical protein X777_13563 [Ooceraea biroi]RLU16518.1 ObirCsp5 [Ooceraea biroi]